MTRKQQDAIAIACCLLIVFAYYPPQANSLFKIFKSEYQRSLFESGFR